MKKLTPTRLSIFIAVLAILMIALAMPGDNVLAYDEEQNPNVRFTVVNHSQHPFSISANGPEYFSLDVNPYSKKAVVLPRGTYKFTMVACNHPSSGTLNLNIFQTMYVPVCGGKAVANPKNHKIDVAEYIKPVRVEIINKTWEPIRLYLRTLDNHYYLNLEPRETIYQIVPRDRYVFSYVACDNLQSGYYEARAKISLDLRCYNK
ncbi:hypothetical protein ACFLXI_08840 [Chloroflexota bacterium]